MARLLRGSGARATCPTTIHVRDSKRAEDGPRLALSPTAWTGFLTYATPGATHS
ncbi:DUF397 domain-containing protein [Streptomyces sp. NPDC127084]|uniref:DUF397 domain-containing protein n=1 Tax=Streptomyces sp. NPDC127084 TaxID=3347133 RepID=UPI003654FFF1